MPLSIYLPPAADMPTVGNDIIGSRYAESITNWRQEDPWWSAGGIRVR